MVGASPGCCVILYPWDIVEEGTRFQWEWGYFASGLSILPSTRKSLYCWALAHLFLLASTHAHKPSSHNSPMLLQEVNSIIFKGCVIRIHPPNLCDCLCQLQLWSQLHWLSPVLTVLVRKGKGKGWQQLWQLFPGHKLNWHDAAIWVL